MKKLLALLVLFHAHAALAGEISSTERRAIMDAARVPAQQELNEPVVFVVSQLNSEGPWVFLHAKMQHPDGSPINYRRSRYADAARHGLKSTSFAALLQRKPGGFSIITYVVGPTDVTWASWPADYGAPATLFGMQ